MDRRLFLQSLAASGALLAGCKSLPSRNGGSTPLAASARVGWVWSDKFLEHTLEGHRENHLRAQAVLNAVDHPSANRLRDELSLMIGREASVEELSRAHSPAYIQEIRSWNQTKPLYFRQNRWSPYGGAQAYSAASTAAGSVIELLQAISADRLQSGFATVRPPGHHATFDQPFGYCIFNNINVGVRSLQSLNPEVRVAIVDIDAHHGNGIQDLFYEDSHVLYISTHQNEWPYTGKLEQTGRGKGTGHTMNIPLAPATGDDGYEKIFDQLIAPAVRRHKPDLLVIAAGFDAHWRDPNSFLGLSLRGYAKMCARLVELAQDVCRGRAAFVLEGGYDVQVLQAAVANVFAILLGRNEIKDPYGASPDREPDITELLVRVRKLHSL